MSTAMGLVAVQAVCEEMYDHHYYLSKGETLQNDPFLSQYREQQEEQNENMPCAKKMHWSNQKNKPPSSKEDYIPYQNVLPIAKTLNEYKLLLVVQEEAEAANALFNTPESVKCTLHYETTSRCKIDGNWPRIVFSFSNNRRFVLHPLFYAFEDRAQIVKLLVETYEHLALLVDSNQRSATAKDLWEKTSIIMTDSVEKNLHIEKGIAKELKSNHVPYHFLCKAHTVEALDRSNITVLANLEHVLKFREALESMNSGVKSFLCEEKAVALCAIKCVFSFVSHDKSAASTNQAELFDYILHSEGKIKHLSLYQEHRFTKLGYSCTSILDPLPYIQMVLKRLTYLTSIQN